MKPLAERIKTRRVVIQFLRSKSSRLFPPVITTKPSQVLTDRGQTSTVPRIIPVPTSHAPGKLLAVLPTSARIKINRRPPFYLRSFNFSPLYFLFYLQVLAHRRCPDRRCAYHPKPPRRKPTVQNSLR